VYYDNDAQLFRLYQKVWPTISAKLGSLGLHVPSKPHAQHTLFHRILAQSDYRFHSSRLPSFCPTCEKLCVAKLRLPDLQRELAVAREDDIEEEIVALIKEERLCLDTIEKGETHQEQNKVRRAWTQKKRETLVDGELLVWIDFFSFFSRDQVLVHTLCFVLESKVSGIFNRRYVDFPCADPATNSANAYFIATAWLRLLQKTDHIVDHTSASHRLKFSTIFIACDNAIVSKYHCAFLVVLHKQFRIQFHVCPLCAHHGGSLCDAHAGHVKPEGKKQDLKPLTEEILVDAFTKSLDSNTLRLRDTDVFPLDTIDHDRIDQDWFDAYGEKVQGRPDVRSIKGLRRYGHLMTVRANGENEVGFLKGRHVVGIPFPFPYPEKFPSGFSDEGWSILPLKRNVNNICGKCSHVHGRPIWSDGFHECLFTKSPRQPTTTPARAAAADDDDDEAPLWSEGELSFTHALNPSLAWNQTTDWPALEPGDFCTVVTASPRLVDIFCAHDNQKISDIHKILNCTVPLAAVVEYAKLLNPKLKTCTTTSSLAEKALLPVPRSLPGDNNIAALRPVDAKSTTSKKSTRAKKSSPSETCEPARGAPIGSGVAQVNAGNIIGGVHSTRSHRYATEQ